MEPFAYGDLIPLGFLLRADDIGASAISPVREGLEEVLRGKRQELLWPYHSGTYWRKSCRMASFASPSGSNTCSPSDRDLG
jgi:hypothetical protein